MESKPIWQSTTFWINFVGLVFIVLSEAQALNLVPADFVAYVTLILNIINRFRVNENTEVKPIRIR